MFDKLKNFKFTRHFVQELSLVTMLVSLSIVVFTQEYRESQQQLSLHQAQASSLSDQVEQLLSEKESLVLDNNRLVEAYEKVATNAAVLANEGWDAGVKLYTGISEKYSDYEERGLDLVEYDDDLNQVLDLLLSGEYDQLGEKVNELDSEFEKLLASKLETERKAAEEAAKKAEANSASQVVSAPVTNSPGTGFSRITVTTEKGNFVVNLLLVDLGRVEVITVTANDGNCDHNCNVKPLADYVAENSGFAGMHATYFCPPDYGSCAAKINSYDFPVYNSNHGKWINADKLFWNFRGMMAFNGSNARFCADAKSCDPGVTAGVVHYPSLINNGQIVVEPGNIPDSLVNVRGYRGAIGISGNWLYLMVAQGATVPDLAYIMKAMGIQNGLNLDGGGTTAMYYNGRYVLGPGRQLPNAIVLRYR